MKSEDKPREGLVSHYLNRRVSRPLAKLLVPTPVTPNQVSFASFLIALISLGLFLGGFNIWAGLAAQASSIVDGVDGDLARLKGMATRFGGFFDAVLDRYADVAILGGLAYWAIVHEPDRPAELVELVGLLAIIGSLMISYSTARAEASLGSGFSGAAGYLISRDVRLLIVMVGAMLGQALATLVIVSVLTNGVVVYRIVQVRGVT